MNHLKSSYRGLLSRKSPTHLIGIPRDPTGASARSHRFLLSHRPPIVFLLLLLGIIGLPESARAALGSPFSSQEASRLGYSQVATASLPGPLAVYTMSRTTTNPLGHTVTEQIREVAGPDGRIFALSWSGIHHPDLGELLGGRLPASLPFVLGERILSLPNLELRMGGSLLHSEGTAWDPRRIPTGADLTTLLALP